MDLMSLLARLLNPGDAPNRLAQPIEPEGSAYDVFGGRAAQGVASNGDMLARGPNGVERTSARYGYTEALPETRLGEGTPQGGMFAPSAPRQSASMPSSPTMPSSPSGGGFMGMFSGRGGDVRTKNVQWLVDQGENPARAQLIAADPKLFTQYLWQKTSPKEPTEYDSRATVAGQYGIDPSSEEGKAFILTGKLPDGASHEFISGRDGSIFRADKRAGTIDQVYGGKPDMPTDVQEYEYYVQKETAAGRQPLGPLEYQQALRKSGANSTEVNIDQKTEGAFDKKLAEKQAETFDSMATDGLNARADMAVLGELENLLGKSGGTLTGLSGYLAKYGVGGEGVSDLQAAEALINRLVPVQRQPGSGPMSDRDVELFRRSLPSLWNAPGGNEHILRVMRGLTEYKQAQGDIAGKVLTGELTRQDARKMLMALPNPIVQTSGEGPSTLPAPPASVPPPGQRTMPLPPAPPSPVPPVIPAPADDVKDWRDWFQPQRKR